VATNNSEKVLCKHCLQLQGHTEPRQLEEPVLGLSHNVGAGSRNGFCAVSIAGLQGR